MPTYNLKVSELVHLSKNAKAIRVNLDKKLFLFQPGQFVMMELDLEKTGKFKVKDGKKPVQKRPFSMSSTPLRKDYLEVTVKTTENAFVSDYFVNYLNKDEEIIVSGPFGKFYFDEKNTEEFMNLLVKEWDKRKFTLIFVSHDERLRKYFDTTISLPSINQVP